jgi:hypothetical protein
MSTRQPERKTVTAWAAQLTAPGERLTLDEVQAIAAIAASDRLLELLHAVQDVQMRLTRLELYLLATAPGYDQTTRQLADLAMREAPV